MTVEVQIAYEGTLRCRAAHGPSGRELHTDAPVDNHGKGESFSPTDLVATALGTCMVTTMGIVAERNGWDLSGTRVRVEKHMLADPRRRIGSLPCEIRVPVDLAEADRLVLEETAHTCPVRLSIGERIEVPLRFVWGAGATAPD